MDARATFFVPSRHGDEVVIETRIARFGRASFDVEHRLMRGEVLAVEGFEKRVLVSEVDVMATALRAVSRCPGRLLQSSNVEAREPDT